jgi:hypothetical protein
MLAQKLRIQFVKHMKLKNEDQIVDILPLLRIGKKHPWKERQSLELRPKDGASRDCHIRGPIPYKVTKPRHYCGCQQVLADRILL